MNSVKRLLVGKPLKSVQGEDHKLTKLEALAMLSSDALSSVAYGTEQIVLVLVTLSSAAIWYSLPLALGVLILLVSLTLSYTQIIHAYPQGGGAYIVSSQNLGKNFGLIAGGSLLVDYMLTVAVSSSAGAAAIISAIPALFPYRVTISVTIVLLLMLMNLRGLRESASFLMLPVYFFIGATSLLIVVGLVKILIGIAPYEATAQVGQAVPEVSIALLLRSFSSGSASLTGVEAISNAVPFFKEPRAKNAALTLVLMSAVLGFFFAGITFLNYWFGVVPKEKITVLSQVAINVFGGRGLLFLLFQIATALILAVAANTGFSAFPMLSYNLAKDKFMPHMYLQRGDRLGYSNGIITLAFGAIFLLFIFGGSTELLIPLYSIGVFVPFALSQSGMVVHWRREKKGSWFLTAIPNMLGAFISAMIVIILLIFRMGNIWPYFIIMFLLIKMFHMIHVHYRNVAEELCLHNEVKRVQYEGNTVIVLIGNVTQVNVGAINYATSIGDYVIAMHVATDENVEKEAEIKKEFERLFPDIRLSIIHSSYRSIVKPVIRYVALVHKNAIKHNYTTTVIVPAFVPNKSWQQALHNQSSLRIRYLLGGCEDIVVANYSYHLKK